MVILKPQYMNEFQCIGAACSDTCCSGWKVYVDKTTYKKYQKIRDKDVAGKIAKYIKKENDTIVGNVACIQTDEAACVFQQDGLCEIQLKYGEEYLSETCLTYPRIFNIVDQQVELSADMSCPEAARLALLNKDLMQFDVLEEMQNIRHRSKQKVNTNQDVWSSCFWEIRTFTIEILQNRSLTVSDRLIFLGLFCERLASVSSNEDRSQIVGVVADFKRKINSPSIKHEIDKFPKTSLIQLKFLMEIMQTQTNVRHSRFQKYYSEVLQAFDVKSFGNDTITKYTEGNNQYYEPFINDHFYILENYLVNQVFYRLFLFKADSNIYEEFLLLTILFCMVRFYLQGVAVFNKEMTPEKAVDIIQAFSKSIEHSSSYLKLITGKVMDMKFDKWAFLITLIKE